MIDASRAPIARMRHERVGERMRATVTVRVGEERALEERQPERCAMRTRECAAAVAAIVENCDAEARLRDIHPRVARNLESRFFPTGVSMNGPFDGAILRAEPRVARANAAREQRSQKPLRLVPLDLGEYFEPSTRCIKAIRLPEATLLANRAFNLHRAAQRMRFDHRDLAVAIEKIDLVLVIAIGIPRFPPTRPIFVERELIERKVAATRIAHVCDPACGQVLKFRDASREIDVCADHAIRKRHATLGRFHLNGLR